MSMIDYWEAGFRVFPLWGINQVGKCECGDPECKAIGKHPRVNGWNHTPHWSDEQIQVIEETQLTTGFGVCLDDHLVIDIDDRNGGWESYEQLKKDLNIDFKKESGFVVKTGGNGAHILFSIDKGLSLSTHHKNYRGIDFKNGTGFIVGYGSLHRSGNEYEREKGFPHDVTPCPPALIDLLKKPERMRASIGSDFLDVSEQEIADMLAFISPDCAYDQWISIGMAIHDATQGGGFDLWDMWSRDGATYDNNTIMNHWVSFGKCANPVTLGTVIHYAEENGWRAPVTFSLPESEEDQEQSNGLPFSIDSVDLLRPPGFVGDITQWINSQCRFPRERLAVATAINAVGNIGGLRHYDALDNITLNTLIMCVAASGTGKEAVQQAEADLLRAAKISSAVHGAIKSEQEITRNIVRHQAAYYIIDELGYLLQKIENARKKGGASYLDGVVGSIMSIYTKANGFYLIGGDLKDDIRRELMKELAICEKKIDENEDHTGIFKRKAEQLRKRAIPSVDDGLERPFLSMIGYTTPVSFDELVTGEQATNGFISRCILMREHETNPKRKKKFIKEDLSMAMTTTLKMIAHGGSFEEKIDRIEFYGDRVAIHTTEKAQTMLDAAADWFEEEAERQKALTGLEAVVRRGYELTAKVSCILALAGRLREPEHVRWAFALVVADIREKLRLAQTNILGDSKDGNDNATVLRNKILDAAGSDGEPISVIKRRVGKKYSSEDIEKMVVELVSVGVLEELKRDTGKRPSVRYKAR